MPSKTGTLISSRRRRYWPMGTLRANAECGVRNDAGTGVRLCPAPFPIPHSALRIRRLAGHTPLLGVPDEVGGVARRLEALEALVVGVDGVGRPEEDPRA